MNKTVQYILRYFKSPAIAGFFSFTCLQFGFWYLLQLVSRFVFIYHRNSIGTSFSAFAESSFHGFALDLAMVSYLMLFSLVCYLLALLSGSRLVLKVYLVLSVVLVLAICLISYGDSEMNRVWGSKFNRQALEYLHSPSEAMASSSEAAWVRILIGTLLIVALSVWLLRRMYPVLIRSVSNRAIPQLPFWLLAVAAFGVGMRGGLQTAPISQSSVYYSQVGFRNLAAVNSPWNFLYYLFNNSEVLDPEKFHFDKQADEAWQHFAAEDLHQKPLSANAKPNVVVVILESFSAYTSKRYGGVFDCTPFLDSISREGWSFVNAWSQGDRTDKGLACVISGWPGQPWGSILNEPDKAARLPSIAREFTNAGYQTAFCYGGDLSFANMNAYIRNSGYQVISDQGDYPKAMQNSKWGAHDETMLSHAVSLFSGLKQPFLGTLLTLSSHEPFEVPGDHHTYRTEQEKFLNSVRYTDRCLRQFVANAAKTPWFANTIFVFVADHGRDIGLPDMGVSQPAHFRIPILFWGPGLKQEFRHTDSSFACQTDIAQTLCTNLLGTGNLFWYSRNLAGPHAQLSAYFFSGGFGILSPDCQVVFENNPPRMTQSSGKDAETLVRIGKSLQYDIVKRYKKF